MSPHRPLAALLATCLLTACSGVDDADRDGDGVPNFDDCEPDDATVYPGAEELCDGKDNNCNHRVDEDITETRYADRDGDGHGDPEAARTTCAPDDDEVLSADDCDDDDDTVFPGAIERCDGIDNDCDDAVDEPYWDEDFEDALSPQVVSVIGDADTTEDQGQGLLRLTRSFSSQLGAAWLVQPIPSEGVRIRFRVRMSGVSTTTGEGMTVAILKGAGKTDVVGNGGPALGLYGAEVDGWAVELDPVKSSGEDTTGFSRHIAVHEVRTGDRLIEETINSPDYTNGVFHTVDIQWVGDRLTMVTDGRTIFDDLDLDLDLGERLTVGFTASTSRDRQSQHVIDDVVIDCPPELLPPPDTDTDAG